MPLYPFVHSLAIPQTLLSLPFDSALLLSSHSHEGDGAGNERGGGTKGGGMKAKRLRRQERRQAAAAASKGGATDREVWPAWMRQGADRMDEEWL